MKKLSALIALIIASTLLFSCNSAISENNPDTFITPYGCEDRFIGAWYGDGEDEDEDPVAFLFLSNGTVVSRSMYSFYDDSRYWDSISEWYTDSGNVLLLNETIFEYKFIDNNTLIITNDGESQQLTRISEHFANFAY